MRALLSVTNKNRLVPFAKGLLSLGYELVSTGGTYAFLSSKSVPVTQISQITQFPEILEGRVKTLHPLIYGGILALRDSLEHITCLKDYGIVPLDLICVNLYAFGSVASRPNRTEEEVLEHIDIGGPTLIRAAAKNYRFVLPVVDPVDYVEILSKLKTKTLGIDYRKRLAHKAFEMVSDYDRTIASYLSENLDEPKTLPQKLSIAYTKVHDLRYGENPHQSAAFYTSEEHLRMGENAVQIHGKALSYNNLLDADVAWNLVCEFDVCTFVVVKHTSPCGVATNPDPNIAYMDAYTGDPLSAFGGVVASNKPISGAVAAEMAKIFYEIIIAPEFTPEAREILSGKKDLRLLVCKNQQMDSHQTELRQIAGGLLLQTVDSIQESTDDWNVVTNRKPTASEKRDLEFAWIVSKHVKSNAITVAKDSKMLGIGGGQPSRVGSVDIALQKAGKLSKNAVMASDAFFPFSDSIEKAGLAGISAVIEPGGSIRDQEIIDKANELGLSVLFTGVRHFKH